MIRAWAAAFALFCFCASFLMGLFEHVSPLERLGRGWWALGIGATLGALGGSLWRWRVHSTWMEAVAQPEAERAEGEAS